MRQQSKAALPQPSVLSPVLKSALANLDIQLEEELARYRRVRAGGRVPRSFGRKQPPKALDLIAVTATEPTTGPSFSQVVPQAKAAIASPNTSTLAVINQPSEDALLASHGATQDELAQAQSGVQLEDYLESSEELLRSLAEEEAKVQAERGFMRSLLTPLGVGSMMLLLLSSAMFGYVMMNPTGFTRLLARHSDETASPTNGQSNPQNFSPESTMVAPQPNLAAQEFNELNLNTLSTLKPRSSRSPVAAKPQASPIDSPAVTKTQVGAAGSATTEAAIVPSKQPAPEPLPPEPLAPSPTARSYSAPAPAAPAPTDRASSTPAPRPSASNSRAAAQPSVSPSPAPIAPSPQTAATYPVKVEIPFDSDRTLETVQQVVPDAYLRNSSDGRAIIQGGAFSDEAQAEARVEELRQQGISAEIRKQ